MLQAMERQGLSSRNNKAEELGVKAKTVWSPMHSNLFSHLSKIVRRMRAD